MLAASDCCRNDVYYWQTLNHSLHNVLSACAINMCQFMWIVPSFCGCESFVLSLNIPLWIDEEANDDSVDINL